MSEKTFTCCTCKRTFISTNNEEEAFSEALDRYGAAVFEDEVEPMCDDCDKLWVIWAKDQGLIQ